MRSTILATRGKLRGAITVAPPTSGSTARLARPPAASRRPSARSRARAVGHDAAKVVPERDPREHHADDAGPRVDGHADERREDASGHQLEHQRAPAREHDHEVQRPRPRATAGGPPLSPDEDYVSGTAREPGPARVPPPAPPTPAREADRRSRAPQSPLAPPRPGAMHVDGDRAAGRQLYTGGGLHCHRVRCRATRPRDRHRHPPRARPRDGRGGRPAPRAPRRGRRPSWCLGTVFLVRHHRRSDPARHPRRRTRTPCRARPQGRPGVAPVRRRRHRPGRPESPGPRRRRRPTPPPARASLRAAPSTHRAPGTREVRRRARARPRRSRPATTR